MQHLAVKAAVSEITDLGEFTAIAATYDVDRVKDQIVPGAFERTIAQWRASGKNLPVHWNHSGAAADIIGAIDPATMHEIPDEGLYVAGRLDLQESEVAREAWRSMKANSVALSFGYLATKTRKRKDGIQDLLEIDLFEITVAPGPANPETRFLSLKAVAERSVPTDAQLRQQAKKLGLEPPLTRRQLRQRADEVALDAALGWEPPPKVTPEPAKSVPSAAEQHREWDRLRLELLTDDLPVAREREPVPAVPTDAELRDQAKALGLPVPPPRHGTRERFRDDMLNLLSSR